MQFVDDDTPQTALMDAPDLKGRVRTSFAPPGNSVDPKPSLRKRLSVKRTRSSIEIQKFAENEKDEDFSDILGAEEGLLEKPDSDGGSDKSTLLLSSKLSSNSWLGDQDDEDDPFAQLEEGFDEMDLEANIARDKYARLRNQVEGLVSSLKTSQDDDVLADISEQLLTIFCDLPDTKNVIISAHGMLPILEILDTCRRRDVISNLLKIVNAIIYNDYEIQENLCFVGGIPIINEFASKKYPREIRLEAAAFVQQMYQTSTLTLQMFVSAGGLNVLVEFLEDDYEDERDLVLIGVNGIWSVFELQVSLTDFYMDSLSGLIILFRVRLPRTTSAGFCLEILFSIPYLSFSAECSMRKESWLRFARVALPTYSSSSLKLRTMSRRWSLRELSCTVSMRLFIESRQNADQL